MCSEDNVLTYVVLTVAKSKKVLASDSSSGADTSDDSSNSSEESSSSESEDSESERANKLSALEAQVNCACIIIMVG